MRSKHLLSFGLLALLGLLLPSTAPADTFDWTVTTTFGLSGSGMLTATPVANTDYDLVSSMTGTFLNTDGTTDTVTGVLPSGVGDLFGQDNLIYPAGDGGAFPGAVVDSVGLGFSLFFPSRSTTTSHGIVFACDSSSPCSPPYFFALANSPFDGTFAITPVSTPMGTPEPGTLSLLLSGPMVFGLLAVRRCLRHA